MKAKKLESLNTKLFEVKLTSIKGGWMLNPNSTKSVAVGSIPDKCERDIKTVEEFKSNL